MPPRSSGQCSLIFLQIFRERQTSVFAVERIDLSETKRYGIVSGEEIDSEIMLVKELVEKPEPEEAPSLLGIQGRYVFTPDIFTHQKKVKRGAGGEIQLTDAMQSLAKSKEMYSWTFNGKRYDIGTMKDWFQSHIELSAKSDFSPLLQEVLKKL